MVFKYSWLLQCKAANLLLHLCDKCVIFPTSYFLIFPTHRHDAVVFLGGNADVPHVSGSGATTQHHPVDGTVEPYCLLYALGPLPRTPHSSTGLNYRTRFLSLSFSLCLSCPSPKPQGCNEDRWCLAVLRGFRERYF